MRVKRLFSVLSVAVVAFGLSGCDSKPAATPAPAGGAAVEDDHADHDHAEGEEDHDDDAASGGASY